MFAASENGVAMELIDHLYAAFFGEAPWQSFVDRSCNLLPNGKAVLFSHDKRSGEGGMSLTSGLDRGMVESFNDHFYSINPWVDHAMVRPLGKVMQADEMLAREDLKRTEFYQDYLRPQEVETGLGVTLHRHADLHVFFSIVCADATDDEIAGARSSLTLLTPHLARVSRSGGLPIKAEALLAAGNIEIDARLRVVAADQQALVLMAETEALSIGPLGRLVCTDESILFALQNALAAGSSPTAQYRYVKRRGGALPLRMYLYRPDPMKAAGAGAPTCYIRLEDPAMKLPDGIRSFCAIYGLTRAEAGIVDSLAAGLTIEEISLKRKTSPATVRTQLKTIFWKTGCSRQADIIRQVAMMAR